MTKATGLIFSLIAVTSAREGLLGILKYVQYILHGFTTVLLVSKSSFLTAKSVNLVVAHDDLSSHNRNHVYFS